MNRPDVYIESLSDEKQEQDAENIKDILEKLIKNVDPTNVTVNVDINGRISVLICGTLIGTIHRFAFEDNTGQMIMKATFQPESVS